MEILGWSEIRVVVVPKALCDLIIKNGKLVWRFCEVRNSYGREGVH